MQELSSQQPPKAELSFQDRLYIIQTVNGLPPSQFGELCFALNPPKGVLPSNSAPQGERAKALLDWAEGPTGPGLMVVDQGLQKFVPKITQPEKSPCPVAFAVSGKMGDLSPEELEVIVQLIRQKTGDDSIELAFITKGSIKLVLNGSPEGLEKLQELFDSGELTNVLEGQSIEYVHSIESDTTDARKVRLLQILRSERAKGLLFRALAQARDLARDGGPFLDRFQARDLARDLDRDGGPFLDRDLARDLDRPRARDINLSKADLSGTNLKGLDLRGISLKEADLTGANVTGTLFGDNPGLAEASKRDLQQRGAIFQDPPSSDVPSVVRRQ